MDIFKKVFNGDERLVITFWGWGFLGSIVYGIIVTLLLGLLGLATPLILAIARLPWSIFVWISVWRSSDKYKGPSHWALIAKGLVILGVLFTIYGFINPIEVPY